MSKFDEERIDKAVRYGGDAFWHVVAQAFPEIKTGDMAPEQVWAMDANMRTMIIQWLENNQESK